jgi:integrase
MKGHIRQRSPGHWAIVLDLRDPQSGVRKRKWHSFKGTKREAQSECSRLVTELNGGNYLEPSKVTVSDFLRQWLDHQKQQIAPRTLERYSEIVQKNIVPALGRLPLTKLQPRDIATAYAKALATGRRDGRGGLSPGTVRYMHAVLRAALRQAVKWRTLTRNPVDSVTPPRLERRSMGVFDAGQTALLLSRCISSRIFIPVLLGALCGLRRGEITALKWRSIDLSTARMSVSESMEQTSAGTRLKETKSGRGRTVALPSLVVEELRKHQLRQAEELLQLGIRAGGDTFVVTREDGMPILPSSLTTRFAELLRAIPELPRIRFHDLRHSHATHLLMAGVHPKIAQERLGHSTIGVTLDLYSHVLPGMQEGAAAVVDAGIRAALEECRDGRSGSKAVAKAQQAG